jgi:hypothetical protein
MPSISRDTGILNLTKYLVLRAFADGGPLSIADIASRAGLPVTTVRPCVTRLTSKKLPMLTFAGEGYDASIDRMVRRFEINSYGRVWVMWHIQRGTFRDREPIEDLEQRSFHGQEEKETAKEYQDRSIQEATTTARPKSRAEEAPKFPRISG